MSPKDMLHERWEWVVAVLLLLMSFAVLRQQSLNRQVLGVVGNLVTLNVQLSGKLGEQDVATTNGDTAHERLLSAANSIRRTARFLELVLLVGAALYAGCGTGSRAARFGLLLWVLYCVVRPVFMALN